MHPPAKWAIDQKSCVDAWRLAAIGVLRRTVASFTVYRTNDAIRLFLKAQLPHFAYTGSHPHVNTPINTAVHVRLADHTLQTATRKIAALIDDIGVALRVTDPTDEPFYKVGVLLYYLDMHHLRNIDANHQRYEMSSKAVHEKLNPLVLSGIKPLIMQISAVIGPMTNYDHRSLRDASFTKRKQTHWINDLSQSLHEGEIVGIIQLDKIPNPGNDLTMSFRHVLQKTEGGKNETREHPTLTFQEVEDALKAASSILCQLFRFWSRVIPFWSHLDTYLDPFFRAVGANPHVYSEEMRCDFTSHLARCIEYIDDYLVKLTPHWSHSEAAKIDAWVLRTRHALHQVHDAVQSHHYAHIEHILQEEITEEAGAGAAV